MKGKAWASWLMAGLLAFGSVPATAVTTIQPANAPVSSIPSTTTASVEAQNAAKSVAAATLPASPGVSGVQPNTLPQPGNLVLTRDAARKELLTLPSVTKSSKSTQDAYDEWRNAIARAEGLDTEKMTFENPWTGKTETIVYNDETQMRLRIQKHLYPDRAKYNWQAASKATDLTIVNLESSMDGMFLGIAAGQDDVRGKTRSKDLAVNSLVRMKASKAAGNVTQLDVDGAALDLEKAEKALVASKRSLENQCRSYNRFVGAPVSRTFTVSLSASGSMPLLQTDDYVAQALQNRFELFSLREQISLSARNLEMLMFRDLHKTDTDIMSEYTGASLELEKMRLELTQKIRDITVELRAASLSIALSNLDTVSAQRAIEQQKEQLVSLQAKITAGRIAYWSDDALVAAIAGLESSLSTARLSLDNKVRQFRQAAQIGPMYPSN